MKRLPVLAFLCLGLSAGAQRIDSLNTAGGYGFMQDQEREMIYEINLLRSNPRSYLPDVLILLNQARQQLKKYGKGERSYSLSYRYTTRDGVKYTRIDTNWHYTNEEDVRALESLAKDLRKIKFLSVLKADSGIYCAVQKHADDQDGHAWTLMHTGSDGSAPWDRIIRFSPDMSFGNENIAGRGGATTIRPRDFILQLLVDPGIPGYGHRYNLLDPSWTHIACVIREQPGVMTWCIQNFGVRK